MNIHMTSGTFDFLYKVKEKYPHESMYLMQDMYNAVLLHETEKSSVFNTPRSFQVIDSFGSIDNIGMVVMNNIPVIDEDRPLIEFKLKNTKQMANQKDLLALRVLRPLKANTYIVLTLWKNEAAFMNWEASLHYKELFSLTVPNKQAQLFIGSSYVKKYWIPEEK
ncbi:heme-degrading monooxygenase HmoA [Cytobacillus eiseniae]|uniref:Heme-degrading monooxygenase HmoA n=1 Tax=Cytobacillus eiseniae TaxID=762947 RepID=A0ABS4REC4_9BACI|nr:antibiotic biosynthesis monooxygenase [Cytobacillus eiseniae]MBP2241088.1 heme-degrading monooxygenase HmoA [Cytobacillus eiseniae]